MATTITETFGVVRADGTLEVEQKLPVPPGRVKVRVESMEPPVMPLETLVEFVQRSRRVPLGHAAFSLIFGAKKLQSSHE